MKPLRQRLNARSVKTFSSEDIVINSPERYQANGLKISELKANLSVERHDQAHLEVSGEGIPEYFENLIVEVRENILIIIDDSAQEYLVVRKTGDKVMAAGTTIVKAPTSISYENPNKIVVKVPQQTFLELKNLRGESHIESL